MMAKGLQIAEPPRRRPKTNVEKGGEAPKEELKHAATNHGMKFSQVAEGDKVQFNKRIKRGVADGYEMLAIRTRKKVPDLMEEALGFLEDKYGKV